MQIANPAQTPGGQAALRQKIQSLNPATGEVLAEFEAATDTEVEAAVGRAAHALAGWRRMSVAERASHLFRIEGGALRPA